MTVTWISQNGTYTERSCRSLAPATWFGFLHRLRSVQCTGSLPILVSTSTSAGRMSPTLMLLSLRLTRRRFYQSSIQGCDDRIVGPDSGAPEPVSRAIVPRRHGLSDRRRGAHSAVDSADRLAYKGARVSSSRYRDRPDPPPPMIRAPSG